MRSIVITNDLERIEAYRNVVDVVMVDLEKEGKKERQSGQNTWITDHKIEDVLPISILLEESKTELWVRCDFLLPKDKLLFQLDNLQKFNIDALMVPMFQNWNDLVELKAIYGHRFRIIPLIETSKAMQDVMTFPVKSHFDYIHLGLNDLSLSLGKSFLFDTLFDWRFILMVAQLKNLRQNYGIGGLMPIGLGRIDASLLLKFHSFFSSSGFIISRGFKDFIGNDPKRLKEELIKIENLMQDYLGKVDLKDLYELEKCLDSK